MQKHFSLRSFGKEIYKTETSFSLEIATTSETDDLVSY
jgi:hypothetical protein